MWLLSLWTVLVLLSETEDSFTLSLSGQALRTSFLFYFTLFQVISLDNNVMKWEPEPVTQRKKIAVKPYSVRPWSFLKKVRISH